MHCCCHEKFDTIVLLLRIKGNKMLQLAARRLLNLPLRAASYSSWSSAYGLGEDAKLSYIHRPSNKPYMGKTFMELLDNVCEKLPDQEAFIFCQENRRITYGQLRDQVEKLASGLANIGVQKGDRCGVLGMNSSRWLEAMFAIIRCGGIVVNINPAYRPNELLHCINKVGVKVIFTDATFKTQDYYGMLGRLVPGIESLQTGKLKSEIVPSLESVIMMDDGQFKGTFQMTDLLELATKESEDQLRNLQKRITADDPVNIVFTSGTTGSPKGATLSHHNLLNVSLVCGPMVRPPEIVRYTTCLPLPLYHISGIQSGIVCSLVRNDTIVFPSPVFEAEACLQAIHNEKCNYLVGTPTMFIDLLNLPHFDKYDLSSMYGAFMGGAPCPMDTLQHFKDKLHMEEVMIGYGLTETSATVSVSGLGLDLEKRISTCGQIVPNVEVKIIDTSDGAIVPIKEQGEVCVRGYNVMIGYWGEKEKTREVIDEHGWFHTGDIGYLDDEGLLSISGRIKDIIIRGGVNIYPAEIEQFLYTHSKIADVQIVGVPDKRMGEEVCACIKLKAGETATAEEIKDFCTGEIAHFKIPRYVNFVETFPQTITGKVQKFKLQQIMTKELNL
ncbi:Acyl-CoA synthetase family member 2, mitochondrial [Holothuria leucospilota]|uniref:Medium-chain acyl-CoA ligase ACSF2, mitochondrial n=1 Tax=Holothuria leucospilota TaxID=206669 RepID=A0A9Q1BKH7_HOLLE|nr:Acyl-CoA synthetase family member 2, mitochondrial [Holothuria leucospilota]